jgi:branched-chain amino acid transport system substrate-binding protein
VAPAATAPKLTRLGDYVFRACFLDAQQATAMASFARSQLRLERIAILKQTGNAYSEELALAFRTAFETMGGRVVDSRGYAGIGTDFTPLMESIKASKAEAIYLPGYYDVVGSITRTARYLGLRIPFLGGDGWDESTLFEAHGEVLNGSYFTNHFAVDRPAPSTRRFATEFAKTHPVEPSGVAALGYDAAGLLFDAMMRASQLEPAAIRDALRVTRRYDGATGFISMGPDNNPRKNVLVLRIENGRPTYALDIAPT